MRTICISCLLLFFVSYGCVNTKTQDIEARSASERFALVIGNQAYKRAPLSNAANDARLMAATLRDVGFDVAEYLDLNAADLKSVVRDYGARLSEAGAQAQGIIYFAGHGTQINRESYVVPIDVRSKEEILSNGLSLSEVLEIIGKAGNAMNLVILDANFIDSSNAQDRILPVQLSLPKGTMVAFSTRPGEFAGERADSSSTLYTSSLAAAVQESGASAEQVFKKVRRRMLLADGYGQIPWEASTLTEEFYFGRH